MSLRSDTYDFDRSDMARSRWSTLDLWATVLLSLFLAGAVVGQFALRPSHSYLASTGDDFAAFYCAGKLAHTKADPYRVEPLRTCEYAAGGEGGRAEDVVLPAPLPGYAIGFFAPIAYLPFAVARSLWFCVMIASLGGAALMLRKMTGFSALYLFLGLSIANFESFQFGQLPPIVIVGMCGAAYLMRSGRFIGGSLCAAATMIEPHLGLPLCLALFLWKSKTRLPFAIIGLVFAGVSILTIGVGGNVDYFTHVLSDQAAAELVAVDQYSLSHLLHLVGIHDRISVLAGSISYLIMIAVGIWLGRLSSVASQDDAYLALVPPATVMLGGPFIHSLQFAAALPAAYMLASTSNPVRRFGWCAVVLLVVPWEYLVAGKLYSISYCVALVALIVLAWTGMLAASRTLSRRLLASALLVAGFVIAVGVLGRLPGGRHAAVGSLSTVSIAPVASDADASKNWGAYLRSEPQLSVASLRREVDKLPTWLGIAFILVAAYCYRRPKPIIIEENTSLRVAASPF